MLSLAGKCTNNVATVMLPPKLTPQTNHHLWPTPTVELFSQYQIITGLYEPVKPDGLVFGDGDEIC